MGVKFSKELVLCSDQIIPSKKEKEETTSTQDRLLKRLGSNAYPFIFQFPQTAPCSVTLQPGDDDQGKPLGVEYIVKIFVGDNEEDKVLFLREDAFKTIKKTKNVFLKFSFSIRDTKDLPCRWQLRNYNTLRRREAADFLARWLPRDSPSPRVN